MYEKKQNILLKGRVEHNVDINEIVNDLDTVLTSGKDDEKFLFSQKQILDHGVSIDDLTKQNNFKLNAIFTPESLVGGNSPRSYTSFTPEEIGRMSPQEFARNEKAINT